MELIKVALLLSVVCIATGHTLTNRTIDESTQLETATFGRNISNFRTKINIEKGCCEPSNPQPMASDCEKLYNSGGYFLDGIYYITIGSNIVRVWCDMTNGGWIVLMKRFDGSQDFNRPFADYAEGFGDLKGEYWIGLNTMSQLTESKSWTLRIDLEDGKGETAWAEYSQFRVGSGPDFILFFDKSSYKGTAGNVMGFDDLRGMKFTTPDVDQDMYNSTNCGQLYEGGWWFNHCGYVILTGTPYGDQYSIMWRDWAYALKSATLRIKKG